jgi:hypothetical protein
MSAFDSSVWARVDASRAWGDRLVALRATAGGSDAILAAVDASAHRHILVRLDAQSLPLDDRSTRGLEVCTRELVLDGGTTGRFIDLKCLEADGRAVFDRMGGDIADRLSRGALQPASVVQEVLESWRRFWSMPPGSPLSASEQVGLFGELWFLFFWLSAAIGLDSSVRSWRGPSGARNDFELPNLALEVKTTLSATGHVHAITGLDQLDCASGAELFLFSLRLREDSGASNSLPGLVKLIRDALDRAGGPVSCFEEMLRRAHYSAAHEDVYRSRTYRISAEHLYPVANSFPRIVSSSFGAAPPAGVRSVEYEIDLSGFGGLVICRNATEFAAVVSNRWPSLAGSRHGNS